MSPCVETLRSEDACWPAAAPRPRPQRHNMRKKIAFKSDFWAKKSSTHIWKRGHYTATHVDTFTRSIHRLNLKTQLFLCFTAPQAHWDTNQNFSDSHNNNFYDTRRKRLLLSMIYNTAPNAHCSRWLACLHLYTYVQTGLSQLSSTYTSVIRIHHTGAMDGGKDCIFWL